jgi:serine O-acetyltransferase
MMYGVRHLWRDVVADYRRHNQAHKNLAFWAVAVYRYGRWCKDFRGLGGWVSSKFYGFFFLVVEIMTGINFHREAEVGKDIYLVHSGNIKIHPGVRIGDRCRILHDVTLGTNMDRVGVPRLGNDVFIGAGAKVLGPIVIGDGARVSANSLVITDVPAGATAVGVPARIVQLYPRGPGAVESPATIIPSTARYDHQAVGDPVKAERP